MKKIILKTVEELQEHWDMLRWYDGVETLSITEIFKMTGKRKFKVSGLSMELEDEYVICNDYYKKLFKSDSILTMFLRESLTSIVLMPVKNGYGYLEILKFGSYGTVYIKENDL